MSEPTDPQLRDRLAEALRTAAHLCDDCCTEEDEAACDAAHPIQVDVLHFDQVADISGPVDTIAETMAAVVQPRLDAKDVEIVGLRSQLDALIAACDAEYAPPAGEQPSGIPALLDHLADQMPPLSPEEELDGWKRQSAWAHHMATRFNRKVWDLRTELDAAQEQLAAAGLQPVPQPPGAQVLECSATLFRTFDGTGGHHSHTWAPQPGMTPVWCPGNQKPAHSCDNCEGIDPTSCRFSREP